MRQTLGRRIAVLASAAVAAALVGVGLSPAIASANAHFHYKISGAAHIVKMATDIPIDAEIDVDLNVATGEFTSTFVQTSVPHVKFKAFGAFDSELDVEFFEGDASSGKITAGKVDFTLPLQIRLKNLTALGFPLLVGDNCTQKTYPTLTLHSTDTFVPTKGGSLKSDPYDLSEWSDACGFSTFLINMNSAGPGNTADVKLVYTPNE